MIHNKFRYILTLVALFAISTGAWADDLSESFTTNTGASAYTGEHFKITPHTMGVGDSDGFCIYYDFPATIEALNGEKITKVEFTTNDTEGLLSDDGTVTYNGNVATVSDVNATSMTVIADNYIFIRAVKVYYTAGPEVTWNAATKTGTFTQPGYNVVLTPVYAPAAAFATEGEEPNVKTLAPTAAEGVIAGTADKLVVEGTVATGQGQVMYAVTTDATTAPALSDFSTTVPTASAYDDATTVYVWYYIQGADTPDGQTATAENTFNDSEICATPIEVTLLSNKFNIAFKAANANTIEGENGKGTVTVKTGDAAAVDKTADIDADHKLKAVKMGSTVTITTKEGYKFRKVEAKKKEKTYTITPRNMRVSYDYGNLTNEATLPYNTTTSELMKKVGLSSVNNSYNIQSVSLTSGSNVTLGTPTGTPGERGYEVPLTITGEGEFVLTVGRTNNNNDAIIKVFVRANSDN